MTTTNRVHGNQTQATQAANRLQPTSKVNRNPEVRETLRALTDSCQSGGASVSIFLPEKNVDFDAFSFNYHTGIPKEMNINKAPKDGKVRGTMCINVSGHAWQSDPGSLDRFAKSNTYNIRITLPDRTVLEWNAIPRNCVERGKPNEAEYATAIDIEFPYMKGTTTIEAWPTGSAGVGGYLEGRKYNMHSADQPYDWEKALKEAEAYDAKNPPTDHRPSRQPFSDGV